MGDKNAWDSGVTIIHIVELSDLEQLLLRDEEIMH